MLFKKKKPRFYVNSANHKIGTIIFESLFFLLKYISYYNKYLSCTQFSFIKLTITIYFDDDNNNINVQQEYCIELKCIIQYTVITTKIPMLLRIRKYNKLRIIQRNNNECRIFLRMIL